MLVRVGSLTIWKDEEIVSPQAQPIGKLKYAAFPDMVAIVVFTASVASAPA
jgi:hypothetical protein